jgi:hypothetical protein
LLESSDGVAGRRGAPMRLSISSALTRCPRSGFVLAARACNAVRHAIPVMLWPSMPHLNWPLCVRDLGPLTKGLAHAHGGRACAHLAVVLTLAAARRVARRRARCRASAPAPVITPTGTDVASVPRCGPARSRASVPPIRTLLTTASAPAIGVQPQTFGCGSPEACWFHSCGVGGPT